MSRLAQVIRANQDRFADLFDSNSQVERRLSPLVGLRNTLAHTTEAQIADTVRRSGDAEVRWFAETLGLEIEIVAPPLRDLPAARSKGQGRATELSAVDPPALASAPEDRSRHVTPMANEVWQPPRFRTAGGRLFGHGS